VLGPFALNRLNPYGNVNAFELETIRFTPQADSLSCRPINGTTFCSDFQPTEEEGFFYDKFLHYTLFNYLEDYIYPNFSDKVSFNKVVTKIDYSDCDKILVTTADDEVNEFDKVILTTPHTTLRDGDIELVPSLPSRYQRAIRFAIAAPGLRVWMEFSNRFYRNLTRFITPTGEQLAFYDIMFEYPDSDRYVLSFQDTANPFRVENTTDEILNELLGYLDQAYDGAASASLISHRVQNWSKEPYAKVSLEFSLYDFPPIQERLYFGADYAGLVAFVAQKQANLLVDEANERVGFFGRIFGLWSRLLGRRDVC